MDRSGPIKCFGCDYRHEIKGDDEEDGDYEVICAFTLLFPRKDSCYIGELK